MRVVFDTDVLIPLSIAASRSARLFSRLDAGGNEIVSTPQILDEVAEKMRSKETLRRWLKLTDEQIDRFLDDLRTICVVMPGLVNADGAVPADPKDDKIIAAAIEANAAYLVSEDKHLRDLKEHEGIKIMSRDELMAELDRLGVD